MTLLCGLGLWCFVPGPGQDEDESALARLQRIDFLWSLILTTALVLLLLALNTETDDDSPYGRVIAVTTHVSAALLGLFVVVEARYTKEPIITGWSFAGPHSCGFLLDLLVRLDGHVHNEALCPSLFPGEKDSTQEMLGCFSVQNLLEGSRFIRQRNHHASNGRIRYLEDRCPGCLPRWTSWDSIFFGP
jgi:hypothetical protein